MSDEMAPKFWAKCPTCDLAYAHVRRLSLSHGWMWVWERECKHKSDPVLVGEEADGPDGPDDRGHARP